MTRRLKANPKDPRSTGRKRARSVLEKSGAPYVCGGRPHGRDSAPYSCGRSPKKYPKLILDANHINKNVLDNDAVNLEWLCRSCHKLQDRQTEKGVSTLADEHGYGL